MPGCGRARSCRTPSRSVLHDASSSARRAVVGARPGERTVVGQHGGARVRAQRLVRGHDVAEPVAVVQHVVPGQGRAGARRRWAIQVQVRDEPGRIVEGRHERTAAARATGDRCARRRRPDTPAPPRAPAAAASVPHGVERVDRGAVAGGLDVDHQLAEPDPIRHRLGHPLRQPAVAFRPGQHHVAVLGIGIAPRVVVHAGPRRRPGQIGPEIVAARVLHPPAQARAR